jgi:hypothetical protein
MEVVRGSEVHLLGVWNVTGGAELRENASAIIPTSILKVDISPAELRCALNQPGFLRTKPETVTHKFPTMKISPVIPGLPETSHLGGHPTGFNCKTGLVLLLFECLASPATPESLGNGLWLLSAAELKKSRRCRGQPDPLAGQAGPCHDAVFRSESRRRARRRVGKHQTGPLLETDKEKGFLVVSFTA